MLPVGPPLVHLYEERRQIKSDPNDPRERYKQKTTIFTLPRVRLLGSIPGARPGAGVHLVTWPPTKFGQSKLQISCGLTTWKINGGGQLSSGMHVMDNLRLTRPFQKTSTSKTNHRFKNTFFKNVWNIGLFAHQI